MAAIKVQNLTSQLPSFSLEELGSDLQAQVDSVSKSFQTHAQSDVEKLRLYQWILEVDHMQFSRSDSKSN